MPDGERSDEMRPPYNFISDNLLAGKVIPFLGSGASVWHRTPPTLEWSSPRDEFLPKANELTNYLDGQSGYPSSDQAELSRIAQYFDGVVGRSGLDEELHKIFKKPYLPNHLHKFLAAHPSNLLIVTTNYDDLLERAFIEQGREFDLIIYNNDPGSLSFRWDQYRRCSASNQIVLEKGMSQELNPNECGIEVGEFPIIYKMHGSVDKNNQECDSYVITEEDYVEFLARMSLTSAIPVSFSEPFKTCHFLFLGYGLRDWNLRVILHKIWKDLGKGLSERKKRISWAIQQHSSQLESQFWNKRNLIIYEMSINEFLENLEQVRD